MEREIKKYSEDMEHHNNNGSTAHNDLNDSNDLHKPEDSSPAVFTDLNLDGEDIQQRWWQLEAFLVARFGKKPDIETILFLIGIQESGQVPKKFSKEQKQDLMHVAVCTLLAPSGYFEKLGTDADGWPHFQQLKEIPPMSLPEQELFLKDHALLYFQEEFRYWQENN